MLACGRAHMPKQELSCWDYRLRIFLGREWVPYAGQREGERVSTVNSLFLQILIFDWCSLPLTAPNVLCYVLPLTHSAKFKYLIQIFYHKHPHSGLLLKGLSSFHPVKIWRMTELQTDSWPPIFGVEFNYLSNLHFWLKSFYWGFSWWTEMRNVVEVNNNLD